MPGKPVNGVLGTPATMNTSTPSNPSVTITYDGVSATSGWGTPPTDAATSGEAWFAAILKNAKAYFGGITDSSNNVTIGDPLTSIQTRNGTQMVAHSYNVTFFTPYSGNTAPDPDDLD